LTGKNHELSCAYDIRWIRYLGSPFGKGQISKM
jgi:hypothetical protein